MKESRFGLAQYLVAELMAVVERRRRRTNCCAAAERERERENRKWSEIERMATRDSDSDQRFRFNGDDDLGGDGGKWFGGRWSECRTNDEDALQMGDICLTEQHVYHVGPNLMQIMAR